MRQFAAAILLCLACSCVSAQSVRHIKVWLKAFIPQNIQKSDGTPLTSVIQAGEFAHQTGIPGPISETLTGVYLTDNRDFSNDLNARARAHSQVNIDVVAGRIDVGPVYNDSSHSINSFADGVVSCRKKADGSAMRVIDTETKQQSNGEKIFRFTFNGSGKNPCFHTAAGNPSPDINWDIIVTVRVYCNEMVEINATGRIEEFPAFEMYADVDGNTATILRMSPLDGATPARLYGPALRLINHPASPLPPLSVGRSLTGTWASTDPEKRFSLKIGGDEVEWTEKFPETGIIVMRKVPINVVDGQFRIERSNNDIEVLRMLGYSDEIYAKVVEAQPKPSFFTFCIANGVINANWNGITVLKNARGKFQRLVQPGERPPKPFTFHQLQ